MSARLLPAAALALAIAVPAAAPLGAQDNLDGRVGRLESEMRAVQRKVFPGGAGQYLQPEVEQQAAPAPVTGAPAESALADLTARVAALEGQMASLTGQAEQADHRAREAQDALDEYRRTTDARLKALEGAGAPLPSAATPPADDTLAAPPVRARPKPALPKPVAAPDDDATPPPAAVSRPATGDPAEDAYLYGYRLWQTKQYPQAEAVLKKAATDYPKSRRYSYSQNLLGRAYLDDGKPNTAAKAFYDNYKAMPDGERAPESLYYLGQTLTKLRKLPEACKVYDELGDVYGAKLGVKMRADVAAGRGTAKCK